MPVAVEVATEATPELVDAFAQLLPQLSSAPPPDAAALAAILRSETTSVLVARTEDGTVVGTTTLCVFRIPTGVHAWIEDVVVDSAHRGGIGRVLTARALELAVEQGARTVDLTSRPSREAANALYKKMGFEQRNTNVYRWSASD